MSVLFSNNASTTLSAGVGNSATSITVADGSVFPAISGGDYVYLTLEVGSDPDLKEIVKCTARSGNTLTIVRAQDGTSARTFSTADKCELRLTAAGLNDVATQADTDTTYSVGDGGLTQNNFTDALKTKLDGTEASADVTDTTNVTAAGALMDSEVTNLAQVKAFDSADYATAAQGTTADAALPKSGGAMTGAITTNSTFDGRDVATDGTKLDGIEASADVTDTTNVVASLTAGSNITIAGDGTIASTASGGNETLAQTLALGNTTGGTDLSVSSGDNIVMATSSTVDGRDVSVDGTKLDGIEASADVTDATNVTAAGALMKSGGTMSGNIDCDGNKVLFSNVYSAVGDLPSATDNHGMFAHVHATGKGYFAHAGSWIVLANDTEKLSLTGGTMSGEIAMGTSKITGVGNPSAAQDVATKDYVDNNAGGGAQSVTPTVSLGSNFRDVTITNYSSYINPVFVGTIGGVSSVWTVVSAGVIKPDNSTATGSATIKVREAGLLESDASSAVTIQQGTRHRYWRLTNFTGGTSQGSYGNFIRHINFYSNAAGTTKNGNYATRTASYFYSSNYPPSNTATDNANGWWSLGNASGDRAGTGTWLKLDNGSAPTVESVCIRLDCNLSYMATAFDLQFSDDNTNWITYMNISGSDISDSNLVIDL